MTFHLSKKEAPRKQGVSRQQDTPLSAAPKPEAGSSAVTPPYAGSEPALSLFGDTDARTAARPLQLSPSGGSIAGQPAPRQTPRGTPAGKPSVVSSHTSDQQRRTQVTIKLTGHASPRWRGAGSDAEADANNMALSWRREYAVGERVKQLLREALPDQQLVFRMSQSTDVGQGVFDDSAPIDVYSDAVGSKETLGEAGKAGRRADDASMRRVEISVSLADAIDTTQENKIKERLQLSGATQKWAIKVGMTEEVGEEFGVGGFTFTLKNRKTQQEVEGWVAFGSAGLGVNGPIPTIDLGGYQDFTTMQPVNFSDFDGAEIAQVSIGFHLLLIGYEVSGLTIRGLPGGDVDVDVSGFSMGGAGITILSGKSGRMRLRETPDTYAADVVRDEQKVYTSQMVDEQKHRVLFETEKADISAGEDKKLRAFVGGVAESYQRGGP